MDEIGIHGEVKAGFEEVKAAFRNNFYERGEFGAACTVYFQGEKIVDLWGGFRDQQQPWEQNTIIPVLFATKGIAALTMALLHSRGQLDYDKKVADYWPEFAQSCKKEITVRQLINHQAGLSCFNEPLTIEMIGDPSRLADLLARQKPAWKPGSKQGYHSWTLGWYQSELLRRIDEKNRTLGQFFWEEIAIPLGLEFYIGLPPEIPDTRLATIIAFNKIKVCQGIEKPFAFARGYANPYSIIYKTLMNPKILANYASFNRREVLALEIPSANGVGDARAIAKLYSVFAGDGHELQINENTREELIKAPIAPPAGFIDAIFLTEMAYSVGLAKPLPNNRFGSSDSAFGFWGPGGSSGFADPDRKIGYAYVTNKLGTHFFTDPRDQAIREALYHCLSN